MVAGIGINLESLLYKQKDLREKIIMARQTLHIETEQKLTELRQKNLTKILQQQSNMVKYGEFRYLDELSEEEIQLIKNENLVYVDCGKRDLFYMINNEGKRLIYSNRQRIYETKRIEYQQKIDKIRDESNIKSLEKSLSATDSKSCYLSSFKRYVKIKLKINKLLRKKYQNDKFRQYKWYAYINKQRSEENLLKRIKEVYGKDAIIIMGDWSVGKQMKGCMSTPNLGLRRKIATKFTVLNFDEFRSSMINFYTQTKNDNLNLMHKDGKVRSMYAIRTYKMANNRIGCINRDNNAVYNIMYMVQYWLIYRSRPLIYRRDYDYEKKMLKSEKSQ